MPSSEDCAILAGYLEAVEAARAELTAKWGAGRLERIVGLTDASLLARFRRQQRTWADTLQAAYAAPVLAADLLAKVQAKAESMQRGWWALNGQAEQMGQRPIAPWVWEVMLADGSVAALVQTDAEVAKVQADGRFVAVYTLAEVGHVLDVLPDRLALAKLHWPGARYRGAIGTVEVGNPLGAGEWSDGGDDVPFGSVADGLDS